MGLNAAVQALKKAEKLKEKVLKSTDLLYDDEAWVWQQQLQRIYQQVLLLDLEYALDRKVEQELWNHGFKNYISILQNQAKDRKNPKRSESQAMLTWCLESASGFYLTLLQEICTAFDLDLSFRRKGSVYGSTSSYGGGPDTLIRPQRTSCSYICQHCLVHLGDLARYRNQNRQAESFYRHAVQLSPISGQPYNQLALLDSSRGDRLGTVFHYVRSVAVRHLFPAAATNLARMFSKCAEDVLTLEGRSKLSVQECVALFLKLHGLIHLGSDLSSCNRSIRLLTDTLTAKVATESFTYRKLVQMLAINLFALHHARGNYVLQDPEKDKEQQTTHGNRQTTDVKQAKGLIIDMMAGSLCALLLPVYTLRDRDALLEYFALPAIKLTLDWIRLEPQVLTDQAFKTRLQIWPSLCRLLNGLQPLLNAISNADEYSSVPLPEDCELQGFLPLEKAMSDLRFSCDDLNMESCDENRLRAFRLVQFGVWLSKKEDQPVISARKVEGGVDEVPGGSLVFEAVASGQAPSSELIRELEQLSLGVGQCPQQPSPSPSDAGSWGGSSTSTPGGAVSPPLQAVILEHVPEKRAGILKPQGSLEKSREKEASDGGDGALLNSCRKGGRQNVAMQAIMRKGVTLAPESDTKQVSFRTPSPVLTSPMEQRNNQWAANWVPPIQPQPVMAQSQQQLAHKLQQHQQLQPQLMKQQQIPQLSPTNFKQPPPLLQQLQQQAQARVAHVPPPFPLPSMSIPPPHIQDLQHAALGNYIPPDSPMSQQLRPPYTPWQDELEGQPPPSEGPQPWWPVDQPSRGQVPQISPAPRFHFSTCNTPPNWGPQHTQAPRLRLQQLQQQQFQQNQSQQQSQHFRHPQLNQGLFSTQATFQQQQLEPSKERQSLHGETTNPAQGFSPYSLFSANAWLAPSISPSVTPSGFGSGSGAGAVGAAGTGETRVAVAGTVRNQNVEASAANSTALVGTQSLWSGPGPSPLERLLEQQKQLREGPAPKSGT